MGKKAKAEMTTPPPPPGLEGKAVVVSGGTTGIGRATAVLLASRGAKVLVFGRDRADLASAVKAVETVGEGYGVAADQSREADIRRVFAEADRRLGGVDVLINNAAVEGGSAAEGSYEDFRYAVDTNLVGYMACCREAIRRMKRRRKGGHIVNVGSMSADVREQNNDVYVGTKAGIQGFSEALRKTVNPDGIKVTLIEPGAVDTPLQDLSAAERKQKHKKLEILRPDDIAQCVYYCLTQPQRCHVTVVQIRPQMQLI